ncbi:hypothetical protein [Aliikangiella sp. IMCC44359]|uniref:hypothetical protein n=1 Tax=Aliikangiella sp. IMCC44359 TaxID=3459125 RepID=UPI00403AA826
MYRKLIFCCSFLILASCSKLPLKTEFIEGCWNVSLLKLGEYTLKLGVVEVFDQSDQVVWSMRPKSETAVRIGRIKLCEGSNEITAQSTLSVDEIDAFPQNSSHFTLEKSQYKLVISSPEYKQSRSVMLEF